MGEVKENIILDIASQSDNKFQEESDINVDDGVEIGKRFTYPNYPTTSEDPLSPKEKKCRVNVERSSWNKLTSQHGHSKLTSQGIRLRSQDCGHCRICLKNVSKGSCGVCVFCRDKMSGRRKLKQRCIMKKKCVKRYYKQCPKCMQLLDIFRGSFQKDEELRFSSH